MGDISNNIIVSQNNEKYILDSTSKGAFSRWLESYDLRMRVVIYPAGYEADHVCYQGHAFYINSGNVKIKIGEEITEWSEGDAFIIPDEIPHMVFNPNNEDSKVIVVDHG